MLPFRASQRKQFTSPGSRNPLKGQLLDQRRYSHAKDQHHPRAQRRLHHALDNRRFLRHGKKTPEKIDADARRQTQQRKRKNLRFAVSPFQCTPSENGSFHNSENTGTATSAINPYENACTGILNRASSAERCMSESKLR